MDSQNVRILCVSSSLSNFRQISPAVQNHLKRVYLTLSCALLASAFGAYLHMLWNIGGLVATLACAGTMYWFFVTPASVQYSSKRLCLLFLTALLKGASDGPSIKWAMDYDTSIVITGYVGIAVAYVCFSSAAMLARRREYLYLGAMLSSGMFILWWLHLASSIFGGSAAALWFELYFGLLVYVGYIVVDTQVIVKKAHRGDMDYVNHSVTIFNDFVAVFLRILVISAVGSYLKSLMRSVFNHTL